MAIPSEPTTAAKPKGTPLHDFPLPPNALRWGGPRYHDDTVYIRSGEANARLLTQLCGLSKESRVLDIGCGTGRVLTGILSVHGGIAEYVGIDVAKPAIDWASSSLANTDKNISFIWVDVKNERYHPKGENSHGVMSLPLPSDRFDVVALFSVFSHMRLADIQAYLQEIHRVLAPSGKVFLSAFTEYGVPNEEENPDNYHRKWSGPLHCVRLNRHTFEESIYSCGLVVDYFRYRHTNDGQSTYVLSRSDQSGFQARVVEG